MRSTKLLLMILAIVTVMGISSAAIAKPSADIYSPQDLVYGKSLDQWLAAYWRWYYSADYPNPDPQEPVLFLPLPNGVSKKPQSSVPYYEGKIQVTIQQGTEVILPVFAWNWEKYADGSDDSAWIIPDADVPSTVTRPGSTEPPVITLDGHPILQNFWDYFVGTIEYEPTIDYLEPTDYGSTGIIAMQTAGFISAPLSPGTHTIRLLEEMNLYQYGVHYIIDNQWVIHVVPKDK